MEATALKCDGYDALKLVMRLARAGHPQAISDLVRLASGLAQALEDPARLFPKEVQGLTYCGAVTSRRRNRKVQVFRSCGWVLDVPDGRV